MISRYKYHELTWIDIERPTHAEVRTLMEEFDISPIVGDELLSPSVRPKVDVHDNYIYLILHFPAIRHSHSNTDQEVDFIIGKKFIITVRYELLDPLHKFSKVFEANTILDKTDMGEHAGFVFFYMIRKLYNSLGHELSGISDALEEIEENIFKGEERAMVAQLSIIQRDTLAFHRALRMHRSVLQSLGSACDKFFGMEFRQYSENILGEYYKVEERLLDQKEMLNELRITNDSLLTAKTNEVIKTLTLVSFTIFFSTLIPTVFGMGAKNTPFIGSAYDFQIILGIMAVAMISVLSLLKFKKWI